MEERLPPPDRWRPDAGDPSLLATLRALIARRGRITFEEFMAAALYDPAAGYYTSRRAKVGSRGDFYTSPEVHPAFGALIAAQIREMWLLLGRPDPFTVVEPGAGSGNLALDVLQSSADLDPAFAAALRYLIVEVSPDLAARQKALLGDRSPQVSWREPPLSRLADEWLEGCLLANEVVDAFPVHLVTMENGQLREIYVAFDGDHLVEETGEPSTTRLPEYFSRLDLQIPEGCRAEVNLRALDWLSEATRALRRGFMIIVDYGCQAAELYSVARPRGTLLCYHRHAVHEDPYVLVGFQDLTAHVDFTSLADRGAEEGWTAAGFVTQRELLTNLGLVEYLGELSEIPLSPAERQSSRLAVEDLVSPNGLGGFKVLILQKGLASPRLTGLGSSGTGDYQRPRLKGLLGRPRLGWGDRGPGGFITGSWEDLLR